MAPFIIGACAAVVLCCSPAAAQGKPWRHALIQPKSDAGILLMPAQGGFFMFARGAIGTRATL